VKIYLQVFYMIFCVLIYTYKRSNCHIWHIYLSTDTVSFLIQHRIHLTCFECDVLSTVFDFSVKDGNFSRVETICRSWARSLSLQLKLKHLHLTLISRKLPSQWFVCKENLDQLEHSFGVKYNIATWLLKHRSLGGNGSINKTSIAKHRPR
jgi:hypothetical protein